MTYGAADAFAPYIEEDLGVSVRVTSRHGGMLLAGKVLEWLEAEWFRGRVRDAEVILFNADRPVWGDSPEDCSPETFFDEYKAQLDEIFDEFIALRGDSPTIIRAFTHYITPSSGGYWQEEHIPCWDRYNSTIHQSAMEHGIPVADFYDAFNGPNHDEDPVDKGYIAPGAHGKPTATGLAVMADVLRALGYEFTIP
jgi:hypothetical protein